MEELSKAYRKFMITGTVLMLIAFSLMIFQPLGREASIAIAVVLFLIAFVPLEFARRIAGRMAARAFEMDRKA